MHDRCLKLPGRLSFKLRRNWQRASGNRGRVLELSWWRQIEYVDRIVRDMIDDEILPWSDH